MPTFDLYTKEPEEPVRQVVPDLDAKFYSATRAMGEARHMAFGRTALQLGDAELREREEIAEKLDAERFASEEQERVTEVREAIDAGRRAAG